MRSIVILIVGSLFVAASLSADESTNRPRPQFTFCPDTLVVDPIGTTTVRFELTPPRTRKPQNAPRYFILSGPGEIDSVSGLWSFTADANMPFHDTEVVVGGVYTHNPHHDTAFCSFMLTQECTIGPSIIGECPRIAGSFVSDRYAYVQLHARGCAMLYWSVLDDANPATFVSIDSTGLLCFMSTEAGTFEETVVLSDGLRAQYCVVQFDIRERSFYGIRINKSFNTLQGQSKTIDVILDWVHDVNRLGGINLLIAHDQTALSLQEVSAGNIFDICNWEYFTYRFGADGNCDSSCPSGLVRVVGIAETNNGSAHPIEDCPADGMTLFSLRYLVSNDRTLECQFLPIRFFWIECGDNAISDESGQLLFIANRVFEPWDTLPIDPTLAAFPGYAGVPLGACDYTGPYKPDPIRDIDFHNGGIDIVCAEPLDIRGDINLNGFNYEIADEVLFSRHFIYGTSIFVINQAGQIAASDVNSDGLTLTVEDFVLLYRRMSGEEPLGGPFPPNSPDTVLFSIDGDILYAQTDDTLGALYLEVAGGVDPYLFASNLHLQYQFDGTITHILVSPKLEYPFVPGFLSEGDLLGGLEGATIVNVATATYRGGKITSRIVDADSTSDYALRIDLKHNALSILAQQVDISLDRINPNLGLSGFNLLVAYDALNSVLDSVSPGTLFADCAWEYFSYRVDSASICDTCSERLVHLVGIGDMNNGLPQPLHGCPGTDTVTLARLHFSAPDDPCWDICRFLPLRFYWRDCDDNVLLSQSGQLALMAENVYDYMYPYLPDPVPHHLAVFPGYAGVPEGECISELYALPRRIRNIDFFNGGIDYLCPDSVDFRGDVDLNGFPYLVGDFDLFRRYLVYGDSVFTINPAGHKEASDVNRDLVLLTLEDFVLLQRAWLGLEEYRCDHLFPSPLQHESLIDQREGVIILITTDSLSAIRLVVSGNVGVTNLSALQMQTFYDGENTRVLLFAGMHDGDHQYVTGTSQLLELSEHGHVFELEAATRVGAAAPILYAPLVDVNEPDLPLPRSFALNQNYPNPFNAGTVISFDLPRASEVKLEVINILGNLVYRQTGDYGAGTHRIFWKGNTTTGAPVASGIYYYRLTAGDFVATRKMLLLK